MPLPQLHARHNVSVWWLEYMLSQNTYTRQEQASTCFSLEDVYCILLGWEFSLWSFLHNPGWCDIGSGVSLSFGTILNIHEGGKGGVNQCGFFTHNVALSRLVQLVRKGTTLRAGFIYYQTQYGRYSCLLLFKTYIYTGTREQQVPLTVQLSILHAMLAAVYVSYWTLQCLSHFTKQLTTWPTTSYSFGFTGNNKRLHLLTPYTNSILIRHIQVMQLYVSVSRVSIWYLSCMLII